MSFLNKGHTHEDVDQMFSSFSSALTRAEVWTVEDLHNILRGSMKVEPVIRPLEEVRCIKIYYISSVI